MTDRAQAFTLEAVVASLLVLGTLLFTLQSAGVTPLSSSTASPRVGTHLEGVTAGLLDSAVANGTLGPTLRYWNDDTERFHGLSSGQTYYVSGPPPTAFGELLDRHFGRGGVAYNVVVHYSLANGSVREYPVVRQGAPTDDAARAVRTLTLYDDGVLVASDGSPTTVTLTEATSFYVPDAAPDSHVYNVVRVEVVVWRV